MLCARRTSTRPRFFRGETALVQGYGVGGFSEGTIVPETSAIPVPVEVPLEIAAIVGCATATGLGAVLNIAAVPAGAKVAVLGAGGVGLNVIMGGKLAGAERIVVADPNPERRRMASEFGATDVIDTGERRSANSSQKDSSSSSSPPDGRKPWSLQCASPAVEALRC
jgi:S-(hydroxymethyl)glutathione dehydrogenase/alcohol dehydrogenase